MQQKKASPPKDIQSNQHICSVCLQDIQFEKPSSCYTECLHHYHSQCLIKWLQTKEICCVCRNKIQRYFQNGGEQIVKKKQIFSPTFIPSYIFDNVGDSLQYHRNRLGYPSEDSSLSSSSSMSYFNNHGQRDVMKQILDQMENGVQHARRNQPHINKRKQNLTIKTTKTTKTKGKKDQRKVKKIQKTKMVLRSATIKTRIKRNNKVSKTK